MLDPNNEGDPVETVVFTAKALNIKQMLPGTVKWQHSWEDWEAVVGQLKMERDGMQRW